MPITVQILKEHELGHLVGNAIEEEYYEQMVRLKGLGFGAAQARDALKQTKGDVDAAMELMLGG